MSPFLRGDSARPHRHRLYLGTLAAIALAVSLVVVQWVVMKMLPFDNKSEFQVVLDMPEGTPVEETARVLDELARQVALIKGFHTIQRMLVVWAQCLSGFIEFVDKLLTGRILAEIEICDSSLEQRRLEAWIQFRCP